MSRTEIRALTCENRSAPAGAWNSLRGLTHSSDLSREGLAMKATRIPQRVIDRATHRVTGPTETGCLISTYSLGSHGYAQIGWQDGDDRTMTLVHRAVWIGQHGPIPEGMTVDHMCKTRACANVEHLRLLSNYENARRTSGRDWPIGRCINGHPNSELRVWSGRLRCRLCANAIQRRRRANQKEQKA